MDVLNSKLILVSAVILFQSIAQIFLKIGIHKDYFQLLVPINFWMLLGYTCIIINFMFWIQYLKIEKLNVATAAISLIYIIIPLLSAVVLKESLSIKMFIGFTLIAIGVVISQMENV